MSNILKCVRIFVFTVLFVILIVSVDAVADTAVTDYYGNQLNQNQKVFYQQYLTLPAETGTYTFTLPEPIPGEKANWEAQYLIDTYYAADYDHPELTDWICFPFSLESYDLDANTVTVSVEKEQYYNETDAENAMKVLKAIANGANLDWDNWTKIDYIEKTLATILAYETTITDEGKSSYSKSHYSCILTGRAVCGGYAETFKILADMIGLPCVEVGSVGHAWDHVLMEDGNWYGIEPQATRAEVLSRTEMLGKLFLGGNDMYILYDGIFSGGTITEPERCDEHYLEPAIETEITIPDLSEIFAELHAGDTVLCYEINDDGTTCKITGFEGGCTGEINIPETIDGYTVTEIGEGSFENCYSFEGALTLPETLKEIGDRAFYGCSGLTGDIVIPASVEQIGNYAFSNCSGFTGQIILHEGLTEIGEWAFAYSTSLTGSLVLPESIESIGYGAFDYLYSLNGELHIPSAIDAPNDWVTGTAFSKITVSENHPSLTVYNDILYTNNMEELVLCPVGYKGAVVIPDGVKVIRKAAFNYCKSVTSINIPDSVSSIGEWALVTYSDTEVNIPSALSYVGSNAYNGCKLDDIFKYPCIDNIEAEAFKWIQGAKKIFIPEGITKLPDNFLTYNGQFEEQVVISLPSTLKTVGKIDDSDGIASRNVKIIAPESIRGIFDDWVVQIEGTGHSVETEYYNDSLYFLNEQNPYLSLIPEDNNSSKYMKVYNAQGDLMTGIEWTVENPQIAVITDDGLLTAVSEGKTGITAICGNSVLKTTVQVSNGIEISPDGKKLIKCSSYYSGKVDIPEGVEEIGYAAFRDCTGITEFHFPTTMRKIDNYAFEGIGYNLTKTLSIPQTVTFIGSYAYSVACFNEDNLIIPSCELSIGAFSMVSGFNSIILTAGISEIPSSCFGYTYMADIFIPDTVTKIALDAFEGREEIPLTIHGKKGSYVEEYVEKLQQYNPLIVVNFEATDESECTEHVIVTDEAVSATCTTAGLTEGKHCSVCGEVLVAQEEIPATGIHYLNGGESCSNCGQTFSLSGLTVMNLPSNLIEIQDEAFIGVSTEAIVVPDNCKVIGSRAFANCTKLKYIFLPESIETIAENAFDGCKAQIVYR